MGQWRPNLNSKQRRNSRRGSTAVVTIPRPPEPVAPSTIVVTDAEVSK